MVGASTRSPSRTKLRQCPVVAEEEAEPAEQIVGLGAAQAFLRPGQLAHGAGPGLIDEQWEASLQEARVEGGIVSAWSAFGSRHPADSGN